MKKIGIILLFVATAQISFTQKQFGYSNPVISGMNPDPSVCRVGEDYYAVTSSFTWFPGVPIYHSNDLINWKMIGYCLDRESNLDLSKGSGIYAPTLRYHNGIFYMITTNVRNGVNFYVTAEKPEGPWSNPIWVNELGGIDPSLFFDDDGKVYFTTTDVDGIIQAEINMQTGKLLTPPRIIWQGTGGRYPEGPHLYKIKNVYYLMISEGGTEYGHQVVVARSNNPWGPFEPNPNNPILTHQNKLTQTNAIQGTGHADLVQVHDGSWWMLFLAFRPVGRHHHIGRETFLAPVKWDMQGWPVVNATGTVDLEMNVPTLPQDTFYGDVNSFNDEFDDEILPLRWNYIRNPLKKNYLLTERKGWLCLIPSKENLNDFSGMTFTGFRQKDHSFVATTLIDFNPELAEDEAGITVFHKAKGHYDVCIVKNGNKRNIVLKYSLGTILHEEARHDLSNDNNIFIRIKGKPESYSFLYSEDGENYIGLGRIETKFLSSETLGGFTGSYIGMYATSSGMNSKSKAYFDWVEYRNNVK